MIELVRQGHRLGAVLVAVAEYAHRIELRLDITPMLGPDSGTSASVLTRAILDIDAPV